MIPAAHIDGHRDGIALVRATLTGDTDAARVIVQNCEPLYLIGALVDMSAYVLMQTTTDPLKVLDTFTEQVAIVEAEES